MIVIALCSIFAAHMLCRYFFPRDLKKSKTTERSSVKSSKNNKGGFKTVKKCSLSAAQHSSTASSGNNTSPTICANLTSPSLSIDQRALSQNADKFKTLSSVDQTFISPSPEKSSILPSTEETSPSVPSSSADQTPISACNFKTSHFLIANETSSLQSSEQSSACRAADQNSSANQELENSSSASLDRNIFPIFNDQKNVSAAVSDPQRPSSSPRQKGCTSPSHDPISYVYPSPEKTRCPSSSPGKKSTSFTDKETSTLQLDVQSNSSSAADIICDSSLSVVTNGESLSNLETTDDILSPIPGPSSTITSGPSECQGRPTTPSPNDAKVPMPSGSPFQLSQSTTSCDAVPGSATTGPVMSCEIAPTALTSLTSVQTTQEISKSDLNVEETTSISGPSLDEKSSSCSNQESCTLPLDVQSNSSSFVDFQTGSLAADTICDSSTNIEGMDEMPPSDPSPPCSIPSGSYRCHTMSSAPTCVSGNVTLRPLMSCEVTPPAIPSLMSIQTTPPESWSNDYAFGARFSKPARHPMPSDSAPNTSSTHEDDPVKQLRPLMDLQTTPPPFWSNDYIFGTSGFSDPSPPCSIPSGSYGCHTIPSAPSCVSGSAAVRPLMSCEVTPPAIPSLMSIQTTPPASWSNDYASGTKFPTPYRYAMPRDISAPRPHGNASSAHGGAPVRQLRPLMDIQTTPPASWSNDYVRSITPLMSIQTSPPLPYNGIRPFRNYGNRRSVPAPSAPAIPSLMSIQTRPPRGTRPPRDTRPRGGSRRPQSRGNRYWRDRPKY